MIKLEKMFHNLIINSQDMMALKRVKLSHTFASLNISKMDEQLRDTRNGPLYDIIQLYLYKLYT